MRAPSRSLNQVTHACERVCMAALVRMHVCAKRKRGGGARGRDTGRVEAASSREKGGREEGSLWVKGGGLEGWGCYLLGCCGGREGVEGRGHDSEGGGGGVVVKNVGGEEGCPAPASDKQHCSPPFLCRHSPLTLTNTVHPPSCTNTVHPPPSRTNAVHPPLHAHTQCTPPFTHIHSAPPPSCTYAVHPPLHARTQCTPPLHAQTQCNPPPTHRNTEPPPFLF